MADILQVAEKLNSDVNRLNNERSKLEGMLESAKINYDKAVKAYQAKYGVVLTDENIQAEYNEVFARTKGLMLDLQEKIESIQRGDYKKNVETVEYDLEPDVEPIREEKVEEKPKRGRKAKATITEVPEAIKEAEDISKQAEEVPVVENGPLNLNFDFEGFGTEDVKEESKEDVKEESKEEVKEEVKPEKKSRKSKDKTLSAADLAAAVKEAEKVEQKPVSFPEMSLEDNDEVDISGLNLGVSVGGKKSDNVETPVEDFKFGDFSGFGDFGKIEEPQVEEKKDEDLPPVEDFSGFGGFGDLNLDLGITEPEKKVEDKKEDKKEDAPITPEGWGVSSEGESQGFDFSGLDDFFKSGNIKFGE